MTNERVFLVISDDDVIFGVGSTKQGAIQDFNSYMNSGNSEWKNWNEENFGLPYNNPDHLRGYDADAYDLISAVVDCPINEIDAYTNYTKI